MVSQIGRLSLFLCLWFAVVLVSQAALAAFEARVSRDSIAQNQVLVLTLILDELTPLGDPDVSRLEGMFHIKSQKKSTQINVVNGNIVQQRSWHYQLVPKRKGRLPIPSITIETERGKLNSRTIQVEVTDPIDGRDSPIRKKSKPDVSFSAQLLSKDPYVGQTIAYALDVYQGDTIYDFFVDNPSADFARIEQATEPVAKRVKRSNGQSWTKHSLIFLVTPLKEGEIKIKPSTFSGAQMIRVDRQPSVPDFVNPGDPFSTFNRLLGSSRRMEPFEIRTRPAKFTARPIPDAWQFPKEQWLPAYHVDVKESTSWKALKAGEPITRTITVKMMGAHAESLRPLEELIREKMDARSWQLYAAKPVVQSEYDPQYRSVNTTITQDFTYVPQHGGQMTLPGLRIPWWVLGHEYGTASEIPDRPLEVAGPAASHLPADVISQPVSPGGEAREAPVEIGSAWAEKLKQSAPFLLGVLVFAVIAYVAYPKLWQFMQRWQQQRAHRRVVQAASDPSRWKGKMASAKSAQHLLALVEQHGREILGFTRDDALMHRAEQLGPCFSDDRHKQLKTLIQALEKEAYGGGQPGFVQTQWVNDYWALVGHLDAASIQAQTKQAGSDDVSLNP